MITMHWTAGAQSLDAILQDGYFRFTVPTGVAGVSAGLSIQDNDTTPMGPVCGFLFEDRRFRVFSEGRFISSGVLGTTAWAYDNNTAFYIGREHGRIYLATSDAQSSFPNTLLPVSIGGSGGAIAYSPLHLDAALLGGGDSVRNASFYEGTRAKNHPASVDSAFAPITVSSSSAATASACDLSLLPLLVDAAGQPRAQLARADFQIPTLRLISSPDAAFAVADVPLPVFLVAAQRWPMPAIVDASLSEMRVVALETEGVAHITVGPLIAFASEKSISVGIEIPAFSAGVTTYGGIVLPAVVSGLAIDNIIPDVVDTTIAIDRAYPDRYFITTSGAFVSDEVATGAGSWELAESTGIALDGVMIGASVLLEDGAVAGGDAVSISEVVLISDSAGTATDVMPSSVSNHLLSDGVKAGDSALPYIFTDVVATAVAQDDPLIAAEVLVVDGSIATDELIADSVLAFDLLESSAIAGDSLLGQVASVGFLQDAAVASDQAFMKTPNLIAWVMNADTGAVAWYDNWAFTSIATVGDKVFASGPDGLHLLGGNADGGDAIDASVQYGFSEFGGYDQSGYPKTSEQKKRLSALWCGYAADGPVQATVETYGQDLPVFGYNMTERSAQQPRSNRIVIGKGLNSRYWRVGVRNVAGSAFKVHSLSAEIMQSSRRI